MSKRLRIIILAAVALVVLVAAVLALKFWPEKKDGDTTSSSITSSESLDNMMGYINVFDYKEDQVRDVVVENKLGGFTLNYVKKDEWKLKGAEKFALNKSAIDTLVASCIEFPATKEIAENPEDLSVYGISEQGTVANINYSTGEKLTLMIGNNTASQSTYVYLKQNDKVYLVDIGWSDPFEIKDSAYLDLSISDGVATDEDGNDIDPHVTKVSYSGKGLENPIIIEENPEYVAELDKIEAGEDVSATTAPSQFMFTSPMVAAISDDNYVGKQNDYFGVTALDVYELYPTAADKAKCGLSNPYVTIEVKATKRNLKIFLGNSFTVDGIECYYAMSNERSPIFIVDAEDFTFFKEDLIGYMSSIVVNVVIDDIDTLTIESKGETYAFETTGDGDDLVVRWKGKKMSTAEYRDLYQLIMLAYCEESVKPGEYSGAADLKITYTYREREKVDVLEYVKVAPRKYLVRLNGSDLALCRSTYVDTLVYGLEAFVNGKDVPSDY